MLLRGCNCPPEPSGRLRPSANAYSCRWHDAHEKTPSPDSLGSKKSRRPSSTLAADIGLSAGTSGSGRPGGNCHANAAVSALGNFEPAESGLPQAADAMAQRIANSAARRRTRTDGGAGPDERNAAGNGRIFTG